MIGQTFDALLNIGCADGYYAVGLAMRMPGVPVFAHDLNPKAQTGCREVAALNGVAERGQVGGLFEGAHCGGGAMGAGNGRAGNEV